MTRIAIIGGGISGLTAAYELELARKRGAPLDWHLYEATDRLGGVIETTRQDGFILEGGPDGWVSEKPWARDLAIELGLEDQLIFSNDATRKTYVLLNGQLVAMPDRMRMMVPEDLRVLEGSPLISEDALLDYAHELASAEFLREAAPAEDESVATFVRRHFGNEVLTKLATPLLRGVFGGDVHKLSVRAVMPQFVTMEREHGSLIAALQAKRRDRPDRKPQPIFTSLRNGMASLTEALKAQLPLDRIHLRAPVHEISWEEEWYLWFAVPGKPGVQPVNSASSPATAKTTPSDRSFDQLIMATSLDSARRLLGNIDPVETTLLPSSGSFVSLAPNDASSCVLASFAWPEELARTFTVPPGFGFLAPQTVPSIPCTPDPRPSLLACTFVDQKFPHRAPASARVLRAFFGSATADELSGQSDLSIADTALTELQTVLGPLPGPTLVAVRRWPRSLPQYEVGHLERIAQLDALVATLPGFTLLGNAYRGVGIPDLVRDARAAAHKVIATVSST